MTNDEKTELIRKAAQDLGEHFDSVQILASSCDHEGTDIFKIGIGNWYARQGMAHAFINEAKAVEAASFIGEAIHPSDGDD